ncbi:hypothetical protein BDF22DRAFT_742337 [Syncephalis plumigaleata]|nr:hypothetical protein BDF22DRAFT_742337 [Syncephalis plumigaleata]
MYTSSTIHTTVHGIDGASPHNIPTTPTSNVHSSNPSPPYHHHHHHHSHHSHQQQQQQQHSHCKNDSPTPLLPANPGSSAVPMHVSHETDTKTPPSSSTATNMVTDENHNSSGSAVRSRSPRRGTKTHVASACYNCKRAHLACDVSRPCQRCRASGKTDGCYDVQHKKRGRPKLKDRKTNVSTRRTSQDADHTTTNATSPTVAAMTGAVALHGLPHLSMANHHPNNASTPIRVALPLGYSSAVAPQPISAMPSTFSDSNRHGMDTSTSTQRHYQSNNGCCSPAPSDSPVSMNRDHDMLPANPAYTSYHHVPSLTTEHRMRPLFHSVHSTSASPPRQHDTAYDYEQARQCRHPSLEDIPKVRPISLNAYSSPSNQYPQLRSAPISRDYAYEQPSYPVSPPYISNYGTPDALAPTHRVPNEPSSSPPLLPKIHGGIDSNSYFYNAPASRSGMSPISPPLSANDHTTLALRMTLRDFRIATASDAANDLWMFTPMQLIGTSLNDLVHASDHSRLRSMQSSLMRTLAKVANLPDIDLKSPITESALARFPANVSHSTFHQPAQLLTRNTPMALHPDTAGPCPPVNGWPLDAVIQDSLHVRVCDGAYRFFSVRMYIGGPGVDITRPEQWDQAFVVCDVRPFSLDTHATVTNDTRPSFHSGSNSLMNTARSQMSQDFFSTRLPERHLPAPPSWSYSGVVPSMTR